MTFFGHEHKKDRLWRLKKEQKNFSRTSVYLQGLRGRQNSRTKKPQTEIKIFEEET
jgi:hypothetical protein